RFLLTVPTELGSSPLMLVRAAGQSFAVPIAAIEAVVAARPAKIQAGKDRVRLDHRDQLIHVSDLGTLCGPRPRRAAGEGHAFLAPGAGGGGRAGGARRAPRHAGGGRLGGARGGRRTRSAGASLAGEL